MFTKQKGTLRALAGVVAVTAALMTAGTLAAQASTGQVSTVKITAVTRHAAPSAVPQAVARTGCALTDSQCSYDSGWQSYNNGGCTERTTFTWWRSDDIMDISVEVYSPYLFAGCRAYVTAYLETTAGQVVSSGPYYAYACAMWDPTCSNDRTWSYQVFNVVPSQYTATIDSLWGWTTH
jgi:hypothetical protein